MFCLVAIIGPQEYQECLMQAKKALQRLFLLYLAALAKLLMSFIYTLVSYSLIARNEHLSWTLFIVPSKTY
jgi:hypothetical protein